MSSYILLTGASGFLGSHLLKYLLKYSDYSILVLKRSFSDISKIKNEIYNTRVVTIDIDIEEDKLKEYFKNNKIDAVIHCAVNYGRDGNCAETLQTNLIFPVKLLELAVKSKTSLFINTDSYFSKENTSYNYLQNYSLSKKSLLLWLKQFSKKIKIVNLVLEHIYGDNDSIQKFVPYMIKEIAEQKAKSINCTYGDQKRDFIFVDDVCSAYLKVLHWAKSNNFRFRTFNVGTGEMVSIKDFIKKIKEKSNSSTVIKFGAIPYREDEIMSSCADNIELTNIGWKAEFNFEAGIEEILKRNKNESLNACNTNL